MNVSRRKTVVAVLVAIATGLCALQLLSSSSVSVIRSPETLSPPDCSSESSSSSDAPTVATAGEAAEGEGHVPQRNSNTQQQRHSSTSLSSVQVQQREGEGEDNSGNVPPPQAVPPEQDEGAAAAVVAALDSAQPSTSDSSTSNNVGIDGSAAEAASSHGADGGGSPIKTKVPSVQPRKKRFDFNRPAYNPQRIMNISVRLVPLRLPLQSIQTTTTTNNNERESNGKPATNKKKPRIAVCFFGLVKNLHDSKARYYVKNIFRPLRDAGYIIDAFMHTYNMANHTYVNKLNGEGINTVLKQSESIDKLVRLLPELTHIQYSDPREADMTMPELGSVLVNGNPWPKNGNLSMKYYLRQLYSVMKVTEMWSNISVVSSPSAEVLFGRDTNEADDGKTKPVFHMTPQAMSYDCVMYLRADLRFSIKLNIKALRNICSRQHDDLSDISLKTDVAVPIFEYGGYNDRFAFGTPAGMFLYGVRGLMLHRFINCRVGPVHAETYLRQFLCDNSVPVHLVPMYQQRVRAQGHVSDQGVHYQRDVYFNGMVTGWAQWNLYSHRTREEGRRCAPVSVWGEPFS